MTSILKRDDQMVIPPSRSLVQVVSAFPCPSLKPIFRHFLRSTAAPVGPKRVNFWPWRVGAEPLERGARAKTGELTEKLARIRPPGEV